MGVAFPALSYAGHIIHAPSPLVPSQPHNLIERGQELCCSPTTIMLTHNKWDMDKGTRYLMHDYWCTVRTALETRLSGNASLISSF